jgi:hypothetical protein
MMGPEYMYRKETEENYKTQYKKKPNLEVWEKRN